MDEMDMIQDLEIARNEHLLRERRKKAELEKSAIPPSHRECDSCGCDIPAKRLAIKPMTRLCVDCQSDMEAGRL